MMVRRWCVRTRTGNENWAWNLRLALCLGQELGTASPISHAIHDLLSAFIALLK